MSDETMRSKPSSRRFRISSANKLQPLPTFSVCGEKKKNEKEEEPLDIGDERPAVSSSSRTRGGRSARLWPMIMLLTRRQQNKQSSSEVVIHNRYSASFPISFCQIHTHMVRRGPLKASTKHTSHQCR